jgi:hypothetical protein
MKRFQIFSLFCCLLIANTVTFAQNKHAEAFEEGIVLIDLKTSIGAFRNTNFVSQKTPIFFGADYGINNDFSAGVYGGWYQNTIKDIGSFAVDANYYYYGGRFGLHFSDFIRAKTPLNVNPQTVDVYAIFWGGMNSRKDKTLIAGSSSFEPVTDVGIYLGVRMYTKYRIGGVLELGKGPFGFMNFGICYKI